MSQYSNQTGLPLPIAAWLAHDTYDGAVAGLSATTLMKSVRQTILTQRLPPGEGVKDVSSMIKSRIGTAIHDAIERAWVDPNLSDTLTSLGIAQKAINRIRVNHDPSTFTGPTIPVYLEKRSSKDVLGVTVTGKFDFIAEGRVHDFKTTSTYAWTSGNKDDDYIMQGSIYRWLNPDIITDDRMTIIFIFMDWNKNRYLSDRENYPHSQIISRDFELLPEAEVQRFVENKVQTLIACKNLPEEDLPLCTDKELWRKPDTYKYYSNPTAVGRSQKNFDSMYEAQKYFIEKGSKGRIDTVKGQVTACLYCSAFTLCSQKDDLIAAGELKL
jgi:hypothetical protein